MSAGRAGLLVALLLTAGGADAYRLRKSASGKVLIWDTREPTVEIDTSVVPKLKGAAQALRSAFSAWRQAGVPIAVRSNLGAGVPVGADGRNVLSFVATGWSFGEEVVAMTLSIHREGEGTIRETDIVFNAQHLTWSADPITPSSSYDIQNTATHEAGHFLGLDHEPARPDAAMYPLTLAGEIQKRELSADDREGASALRAAILAARKGDGAEEIGAPLDAEAGCGGGDLTFAGLLLLPWLPRALRLPPRSRALRRRLGASSMLPALLLLAAGPAQASVVRPLSLAELARTAEVVSEGRVTGMHSYREAGWIYTDYLIAISRHHRGWGQSSRTITIRTPGGRVDGLVMEVVGMPRLAIGTRLLVFGRRYGGAVVPIGLASGLLGIEGKHALWRGGGHQALKIPLENIRALLQGRAP